MVVVQSADGGRLIRRKETTKITSKLIKSSVGYFPLIISVLPLDLPPAIPPLGKCFSPSVAEKEGSLSLPLGSGNFPFLSLVRKMSRVSPRKAEVAHIPNWTTTATRPPTFSQWGNLLPNFTNYAIRRRTHSRCLHYLHLDGGVS